MVSSKTEVRFRKVNPLLVSRFEFWSPVANSSKSMTVWKAGGETR
jgi:hypothetical protein